MISRRTLLLAGLFAALALSACSTAPDPVHLAKVAAYRARLPYTVRVAQSRSMETVIDPGSIQTISPSPYNRLQTGMIAIYWPGGSPAPVCHFVGHRIGTDSWETHGMNQASDLTNGLGFLLTRENYIGVIK